jgi:hypothetical protein
MLIDDFILDLTCLANFDFWISQSRKSVFVLLKNENGSFREPLLAHYMLGFLLIAISVYVFRKGLIL